MCTGDAGAGALCVYVLFRRCAASVYCFCVVAEQYVKSTITSSLRSRAWWDNGSGSTQLFGAVALLDHRAQWRDCSIVRYVFFNAA